ncbi:MULTISPECIES: hypothetical protein [Mycobacterium]|uniref:hypothetical protein n=1 Tax=Mycobacterium TaxID=1763 RepID=UPI0019821575|nr:MULTISPECIES: hypothetical protein [Mycobacterium]MDP7706900.1 hypothetical protein [Mycobacterium sp. TY815]
MDHDFELAFNLCDEAAGRIQDQQYGITRILAHNHGPIVLSTVHQYTRESGHHLILLAHDHHGDLMAAVEVAAAHLDDTPNVFITKVRAGELIFHADPHHQWTYRATRGTDIYTLTALIPHEADDPMWTTQFNDADVIDWDDLDEALDALLTAPTRTAGAA